MKNNGNFVEAIKYYQLPRSCTHELAHFHTYFYKVTALESMKFNSIIYLIIADCSTDATFLLTCNLDSQNGITKTYD